MKIELHHRTRDIWCTLSLDDDRKALASMIPFLNAEEIDAMKMTAYQADKLPNAVFALAHLESLFFIDCQALSGIPSSISRFEHLQELGFVACADFGDLEGISELDALRALHVVSCPIFDGPPDELGKCKALELMDLSHNLALKRLNVSILPPGLRIVDLRGCYQLELDDLPDTAWPKLCSLNASDWTLRGDLPADPVDNIGTKMKHLCTRHKGGAFEAD